MNFEKLSNIIVGVTTLGELEGRHPALGRDLSDFLKKLERACEAAYSHFLANIKPITTLQAVPEGERLTAIREALAETYDHQWFKNVGQVCDVLHSLTEPYAHRLHDAQARLPTQGGASLWALISVINDCETDLEDDIRDSANALELAVEEAVRTGDVQALRQLAIEQRQQLNYRLQALRKAVALSIATGNSATEMLRERSAEEALSRRPLTIFLLNSLLLVVLLAALGAVARLYAVYYFVLIVGSAFTGVTLLNAFYLRQVDLLSEEGFLVLVRLALLKFFAPLTRRTREIKHQGEE